MQHGEPKNARSCLPPHEVAHRYEPIAPDVIGKQVIAALRQMASELEEGALLTVDPNRTRLRVLPLQPRI